MSPCMRGDLTVTCKGFPEDAEAAVGVDQHERGQRQHDADRLQMRNEKVCRIMEGCSKRQQNCTGVKLFIGSKGLCVFCSENCTPEGRGGEKEGVQISK